MNEHQGNDRPQSDILRQLAGPGFFGRIRSAWSIAVEAFWRLDRDDGLPLSGNIAFSIILSAFPFLILLTSMASFIGDSDLAIRAVRMLLNFLPAEVVDPLREEIFTVLNTRQHGILTFSLAITLVTASSGIKSIRNGLNRAYGLYDERSYLWLGILDLFFVFIGSVGLLALSGLVIASPVVFGAAETVIPFFGRFRAGLELLRFPLFALIAVFILISVHILLPAKRLTLQQIMPGVAITLVIWILGAAAFGFYLSNFAYYASTYAGLAGIAVALMFLYLSGAVLLYGAEVNQVLAMRRAAREAATRQDPAREEQDA